MLHVQEANVCYMYKRLMYAQEANVCYMYKGLDPFLFTKYTCYIRLLLLYNVYLF